MPLSKIQLRILLPAIFLLTVSVLLVFAALKDYQVAEQRLTSKKLEQARQSLGFLKQEIEYHASQPEPIRNAQRLLMTNSLGKGIETLVLINASGQVLASRFADKHLETKALLPRPTRVFQGQGSISPADDGQSIQAYVPLTFDSLAGEQLQGEQLFLYASYDLNTSKAAIWQQIRSDFQVIWLAVFITVIIITYLLERLVTRPLAKLVKFSQHIAHDYSGQQNPDHYLGEIAMLNQALNTMSSKVARTVSDLNTQQENLEVTLHSIGDAVITTDSAGLVTRMNPIAEQLTGWYAYEARGQSLHNTFPIVNASTREPIANPVDTVLATGETVYLSSHTTLLARDGSEYQIADSAAPIRNASDEIVGMILVFNDITEEYQLRQAARNIQQQIQGLFNDMLTMAAILDIDGSVTFINNTPLRLRGVDLQEVIGKKLWDCPWFDYDLEIRGTIETDCIQAAAGKQGTRDIQISNTLGELVWAELSIHPVLNEEGQIIQLLAEGHNISPRKKAEEELSASMQRIKLYREQTPLAAIEWNIDFQIEDWNEAASQLFGYTLDEVKGSDASVILPDSATAEVAHVCDKITHHRGGEININQNITKDGHSILCEWHNSAIVDQAGKVIGMASLVMDISTEHEAKLALVKKEQEQREILNTLVEGIITINDKGEVLSINPAAEIMFGYTNEEIIEKDLSAILPNFDLHKIDHYVEQVFTATSSETLDGRRETVGQRKNKTTFPLQISGAELLTAADGSRRFIGSCNDLTETKFQQEHLQRTQKMDALGKIVGGIAHDYNNMLSVILGYADLMAIKYQGVEGLDKYIDNISQAGERGRDLTKRMLAFSKQEGSQPEAIDLHSVLTEQNELLGKSITALVKIEYQLCESPWLLWLDPGELEDTLLNLAINAKFAMSDGGVLTLATHKRQLSFSEARILGLAEGDYMELSVADNGSGISEELQDKIFDPFFTTKGSDGTGLGLSQAYSFMDRCGGTIRVDSTPGLGTTFSLYFPRYEGTSVSQATPVDKPLHAPVNAEKILIVDDEPALRELTREILSIAGYQVLTAGDGNSALGILASETIDLMISDIIMPEMNGYDLVRIVGEKYPQIKILLTSGYTSKNVVAAGQERLYDNILRKPFRSVELLDTVAGLLESQGNVR